MSLRDSYDQSIIMRQHQHLFVFNSPDLEKIDYSVLFLRITLRNFAEYCPIASAANTMSKRRMHLQGLGCQHDLLLQCVFHFWQDAELNSSSLLDLSGSNTKPSYIFFLLATYDLHVPAFWTGHIVGNDNIELLKVEGNHVGLLFLLLPISPGSRVIFAYASSV